MPQAERKLWQDRVRVLLRNELTRRGVSQRELVGRLAAIGVQESEKGLSNKLVRGSFSAAFLVACLDAIGCTTFGLPITANPLPCPFCGCDENPILVWNSLGTEIRACCAECHASTEPVVAGCRDDRDVKAEALVKWNRRP